jgi:hypothetical protein
MGKPEKKAAVKRLTKARERLANTAPGDQAAANAEVVEAEKDVRFGRVRGWDYED